jgi:hypothetical protein
LVFQIDIAESALIDAEDYVQFIREIGKNPDAAERWCRTERRRDKSSGANYPWLVRSTAVVNQFYIYCVDRDFGPLFLKFSSYFPYTAKLCINGHEYAKQQLAQEGIAFLSLDNGVLSCDDPKRLQAICDGLSGEKDRGAVTKMAALVAAPLYGCGSKGGLPLSVVHPTGEVLADSSLGPARNRARVL